MDIDKEIALIDEKGKAKREIKNKQLEKELEAYKTQFYSERIKDLNSRINRILKSLSPEERVELISSLKIINALESGELKDLDKKLALEFNKSQELKEKFKKDLFLKDEQIKSLENRLENTDKMLDTISKAEMNSMELDYKTFITPKNEEPEMEMLDTDIIVLDGTITRRFV